MEPFWFQGWSRFGWQKVVPRVLLKWCQIQQNSSTPGALLENGATSEGGAIFVLNMIIKEKTTPPSKVALFSKTVPGCSRFLAPLFFLSGAFRVLITQCIGELKIRKKQGSLQT